MIEDILTSVAKGLSWVLFGILGFLFTIIYKKQSDTYSKDETKELIDLKMQPLIQSLDRHTDQLKASQAVQERTNDSLQRLHKDFAVMLALQGVTPSEYDSEDKKD